jgi:UDP-N-acetylglucosamine--N-acetylmuramyl-(pentapeptide) pyrophosphoryl-undecaprenol N-acetylglucosamine transferase
MAFDETKRWLRRQDNVEVIGTPTRESLGAVTPEEGRQLFGLPSERRIVLVFGGSLGASSINGAVLESLDDFLEAGCQFIWQTGQSDLQRVSEAVSGKPIGWIGPFIDKMEFAFAAADVVVCRAGATTLAELTRLGKPAILVPYPHAAADHQTSNARSLVNAGAALMIPDHELAAKLESALVELVNDQSRLDSMSRASLKLGKPKAGDEIAQKILAIVR